jgi:hypothetical protein
MMNDDEVVWRRLGKNWIQHYISPPRHHIDEAPTRKKTVPRPLLGIQLYKQKRATVPTLQPAILLLHVLSTTLSFFYLSDLSPFTRIE